MVHEIFPHHLNNQFQPRAVQPTDRVVIFADKQVLVQGELGDDLVLPQYQQISDQAVPETLRFLFTIDDTGYYLLWDKPESFSLDGFHGLFVSDMRQVRTSASKLSYFVILTAWHLYVWYESVRFCGHCGQPLTHDTKLRMLRCPSCGNLFFPKISPAVIIGVTKGDSILMSKYAGRSYTGFALLAGFVEIGETPEESVVREVMEEVGLSVRNVRYYKSQPWGLDGNLSLGFFCELDGPDTIQLDREELSMAQWYSRDEIPVDNDEYTLTYDMIQYFKSHPEAFEK